MKLTDLLNEINGGSLNESTYDIAAGYLGGGLTIWDKNQEEDGDYKTVAHISKIGELKIIDKNIPNEYRKLFVMWAKAMKNGSNLHER